MRLIREPAEVRRQWVEDAQAMGIDPTESTPNAWVDQSGKLNVDSTGTQAPVRSEDIVSGPLPETNAPPQRYEPPPSSSGGAGPVTAAEEAIGPRTAAEEPSGPRTAGEEPPGPATGGEEPPSQSGGAEEAPGVPSDMRMRPIRMDHPMTDPVEIAQRVAEAARRGRIVRRVDGQTDMDTLRDLWRGSYGQSGEPPVAWVDTAGNVVVDESRVPEINQVEVPQGPLREPAVVDQEPVIESEGAPASQEMQVPAFSREVGTRIEDPVTAAELYFAERDAGRIVFMVKDPYVLVDVWQGQYQQSGEAPPAWVNSEGVLTVDVNRVDINNRPNQEGGTPAGGDGGGGAGDTERMPVASEPETTGPRDEGPESGPNESRPSSLYADQPITSEADLARICGEIFNQPLPPLESRVVFHESMEGFVAAYQTRSPGREPPGMGFYNGKTGQIHIAPGGERARLAVHEAVHMIARDLNPDGRQLLGPFVDEGITDMITMSRLGPTSIPHSYERNIEFAQYLSNKLGREAVENAVLHGDYVTFQDALARRFNNDQTVVEDFLSLMWGLDRGGNPGVEEHLKSMIDSQEFIYGPMDTGQRPTRPMPAAMSGTFRNP
jgi:hypothetical protein